MSIASQQSSQWTERPSASRAALNDIESMFQLLFERSADAMTLQDPRTGVFLDVNDASVRMTAAPNKAALLNSNPVIISPERQPDGSLSSEKVKEVIQLAVERGSHRFDWVINRFDGTQLPVEIVLTLIRSGEQPLLLSVSRDISERKKAEQEILELNQTLEKRITERTVELTASEDRLRTLLEHAPEAIVVFDGRTGRFISGNAHACRLYGLKADELPKRTPADVSPEYQPNGRPSAEMAREKMDEALNGGSPTFDWMHRQPNGRLIPTEVRLVRLPAEGQSLLCATIIDNTERIQTEQALRRRGEQMQRHRNVLLELAKSDKSDFDKALKKICMLSAVTLDVARVSYWSLQDNDTAILCESLYLRDNHGGEDKFKGTRLDKTSCPDYFRALATKLPIVADEALTHPATSSLAEGYLKQLGISSMLDAPVWVRGEVVGVVCHEHVGPAREWTAEEIDFASALAAMVSLALEESNRARSERLLRESEEKFRALFEASSQGVMLHDEHQYLEVNPACVKILGYDSPADLIGQHPRTTSPPVQPNGEDTATLADKYIQECLSKGHVRFEWLARRKNGENVPIEVILTRINWGGKQIIQAAVNDISERKKAEAELRRALESEKELGRLKGNFVSMVSHEFRTPLGIIQSSAEILGDYFERLDPGERGEQLESITKNTRRMAEMMEEILVLSRLEAGKMVFKPEPLDFTAFCRRVVEEVLSATNRRCVIELSLASIPAETNGDESLLGHIFTNLLNNAVKYSQRGATVRFAVERDGRDAVCSIRDHGIGISSDDQQRLFNTFQRGGNVGDRPGTGLGLVLVKRSVELHGGDVKIESKVGEGTNVTVRLPLFTDL